MRAIVTGATGFVGQWLVRELCANNHDVTVIVRDEKKVPAEWRNSVEIVESALENYGNLEKSDFKYESYDVFFILRGPGHPGMTGATMICS